MTKIKGMDISYAQGKISVANFKKAKAAGIKYVILRIGYTGYEKYICKMDAVFENNYKNAKAAGLLVGIYYYSLANGPITGGEEADFTIKHLKGKEIDYPVYLDVEDPRYRQSKASKKNLADACDAWCKKIAAAGYTPGVYASLNWFNNKIGKITAPHTKWVAQYNKTCDYKGDYDMWQYSSTEGVPGISSKTDVNWCYKKFAEENIEVPIDILEPGYEYKYVAYDGTLPKIPLRGYFNRGDDSQQVKLLQEYLNWYGDFELVIDTVVGSKTIAAVEVFQKDQGLAVDGLFGKKCLEKAKSYKKKIKVKKEEIKTEEPVITTTQPAQTTTTTTIKTYTGEFPSLTIKKTLEETIDDAIRWGKIIANDNRFHYGYTNSKTGVSAHHNGCYFCGTQGSNKNGILDKQYSYCCNPFIGAMWAHGGQIPAALKMCKNGSSWDFGKGHGYDKSKLFKNLGHPDRKKLKKGDVLCSDYHVAMYIGDGKLIEASGGDNNKRNSKSWNNSIRYKTMTDNRYKSFKRVHRLKNGVKFTKSLEFGDLNKEIKKLQKFLNWYGNYGLTVDGMFMEKTLKAVKDFQKTEGLKADGVFGKKSLTQAKKATKKKQ